MTSNLLLAWRNRLGPAAGTSMAGSVSAAPMSPSPPWSVEDLSLIRTPYRGESCRIRDPNRVGTRISVTFQGLVDLVALPWHTLPEGATCRVLGYDQAGAVRVDSGTQPVWPARPWGSVTFGDPAWWGHSEAAEWGGFWRYVLPTSVMLSKLDLIISLPAGAQYYLLPWLFVGEALRLEANFDWGAVDGWAADGELQGVEIGVPVGSAGNEPRTFSCTLSHLTEPEAVVALYDLVRYAGRGRNPFIVIPDPADDFAANRRSLVAFFAELPALERVRRGRRRTQLSLMEWMI